MKTTDKMNKKSRASNLAYASPYDCPASPRPKNPVVRAGMSVFETVMWLIIMAALAIGMIIMLWSVSR